MQTDSAVVGISSATQIPDPAYQKKKSPPLAEGKRIAVQVSRFCVGPGSLLFSRLPEKRRENSGFRASLCLPATRFPMSLLCVLNAATTRIQAAQRGRIARRSAAPHRESAPWAPATPPKPLAADTSPSLASVLGGCNPQAALAPLGSLHVFGGAPSAGSGILPPPFPPPPPAPPPVQHNLAPPAEAPPPIQIPGFHASSPPMTRALSDGCVPSPHTAYHARARALAEPHHHHHHHHRAPSFPHNVYNSQPSTLEQHREQLLTAIVIDRL